MTAATKQGLKAAMIQHGKVLDVDVDRYMLVVATEFTKKIVSDITFASPYMHPANGEGVYVMPEVGSLCWLCEPSDGGMPFVMAWSSAQDEGNFKARKRDLNPGDIFLGTRDDNFLILRRGGVVQIGGGPLSQRLYLPVNNAIRDFCENYFLNTIGGDLEWTIQRSETDTDGNRPALLRLAARQFASDKNPLAELKIGSHEGDDPTILTLTIKESGNDGAATKIALSLRKDGTVQWDIRKDLVLTIGGQLQAAVTGDVALSTDGNMNLQATQAFGAKGLTANVEATTGPATVKSPVQVSLDAPQVNAGGASAVTPVVMATPTFLAWLFTHSHNIIVPVPGTPVGPPLPPPPADLVSTVLKTK